MGRVGAPFGVLGWNHFFILADDPQSWLSLPLWYLGNTEKSFLPVRHKKLQQRGEKYLVQIENNESREKALTFEGLFLGAPLKDLPSLSPNEFYWEELKGMMALLPSGEILGEVVDLMESPAHPVLIIKNEKKEHLLPFVPAIVLKVDKTARTILVEWGKDW